MPPLPDPWRSGDWQSAAANYDKDDGLPGVVAPTGFLSGSQATGSLTSGRAYFVRFRPSRPLNITLVAFAVVSAASVDDPCDVGVYDSAGTRLVSSGSVSGRLNSTGIKTVPLTITLLPQAYYAGFAVGTIGGTAAQLAVTGAASTTQLFGGGVGVALTHFVAAFPLPASFVASGPIAACPILALRES